MTPTDLVVVLPGIMGSTLRHDGKLVWAPSGGSALRAIGTFTRSIKALQLPEGVGDHAPDDGVEPVALMPDRHVLPGIWTPVKGYDRLLARLRDLGYREDAGNLLPVPYDWRLSNRYNGARLQQLVEPALERRRAVCADARVVFVCHSMGGLVARWYIERCGGAEITRKLITFGTPYRGAAKALDQLVNGVRRGIGPLSVDLTLFARSLPSIHELLPEYACIRDGGDLKKTTEVAVPELRTKDVADAMQFHTDLRQAESQRAESVPATHAIVGFKQPTSTTVSFVNGRVVTHTDYRGDELHGDSTVPLVGGSRSDVPLDSNMIRRIADKHGNLQRNAAALDELEGILTAKPVEVRAPHAADMKVDAPELILAGEPLEIDVALEGDVRQALTLKLLDEAGRTVQSRVLNPRGGTVSTAVEDLEPGAYAIELAGPSAAPVSADVLVWPVP